ncbi:MAG: Cu2+-exporting ATPase [Halioglobus sp.]|jgi:Cu2+-exporting ATPase
MLATLEPTISSAAVSCYHCGEAIPSGADFSLELNGISRPMCCPGCCAVASLISASGLQDFYQHRTTFNERPSSSVAADMAQYSVYDDPDLAATFSTIDEDGRVSAQLLLSGISCAACTWLIEHSLSRLKGVQRAAVHFQQARLDILIDPSQCQLSDVFIHLLKLGYRAQPFHTDAQKAQLEQEQKTQLKRLAVAALGMMQVSMFAIALHAGDLQGMDAQHQALLRWVSLPVAVFVVTYAARGFFNNAWRSLRHGALVMDVPVSLAIGLALVASVWATLTRSGQVYFDSVVMFTFFLLLGRYLEQRARQRHLETAFDLEQSLPSAVTTLREEQWLSLPRVQLRKGDTVLIKPGETICVDAEVVSGHSAVREDAFNGEHLPREVHTGDTVYAGTVNSDAPLQARALGNFRDSRLAALQRSVQLSETEKPQLVILADRIASWFVAWILLLSAVTALVWLQLEPENAFWITLSVLVISCPCALALATPAALTNAAGALRSSGIAVQSQNALEALASCTHLIFDKTGTLTDGKLSIAEVIGLNVLAEPQILELAAALQRYTTHPVAAAFSDIDSTLRMDSPRYTAGAGVEAQHKGEPYRMGTVQFCRDIAPRFPAVPDSDNYWVGLCRANTPLAWIALDDHLRSEAAGVIQAAVENGLKVELLTGDSSTQGISTARELGIPTVFTGMSPQQKSDRVQVLQAKGARVAMVGDGLNDAPVLSVADASIAVAGATDLARTQADFVIVDGDLTKVTAAWRKAWHCRRVIRENLFWALLYNSSALPLAALGVFPPWAAALGMSASSLIVVGNSLRLNR